MQTEINVSSLPAGMYIVQAITTDGEQQQGKFIKQ
ncbi:MAG: T9SS type A sorting domain-containing protein [Paludibacteraceae bacterium]|nr:T9SS type A sorting domain-containing protein [Paludibacteraceae bacterium]